MNAVRNIAAVYLQDRPRDAADALPDAATIMVPAALPEIVSGLRIGFSLTLLGMLIGEMFASQRGIGYLIMNAIGLHDVADHHGDDPAARDRCRLGRAAAALARPSPAPPRRLKAAMTRLE